MRPVGAFVALAAGSATTAARANPRTVRRRINLLSTSTRLYTANRVAVPPRASTLQVREVKKLNGWRRTVRIVCLSRVVPPGRRPNTRALYLGAP